MQSQFIGFVDADETSFKVPFFASSIGNVIGTAPTGTPTWTLHNNDGTILDTGNCTAQAGVSGDSAGAAYYADIDLSSYAIENGSSYVVSITHVVSSVTYGHCYRFCTY